MGRVNELALSPGHMSLAMPNNAQVLGVHVQIYDNHPGTMTRPEPSWAAILICMYEDNTRDDQVITREFYTAYGGELVQDHARYIGSYNHLPTSGLYHVFELTDPDLLHPDVPKFDGAQREIRF